MPSHTMLILCGALRRYVIRAMPWQRIAPRTFAVAVPCFAEQSHCDYEQRPCGAHPVHAVAVRVASVLCRRGANLGSGRASLSRCGCDRIRALPCRRCASLYSAIAARSCADLAAALRGLTKRCRCRPKRCCPVPLRCYAEPPHIQALPLRRPSMQLPRATTLCGTERPCPVPLLCGGLP